MVPSSRLLCMALLPLIAAPAAANWDYGEHKDGMTGAAEATAEIRSVESLELESPYSGKNYGTLNVRRSKARVVVWLEIEKGQFICSVSGCDVEVRFDDRPPTRFAASGPADYNSRILVLIDGRRFIAEAGKTNSQIRVRANIYRSGAPVMRFASSVPLYLGPTVKAK